jgi:uncharacterized protein
MYKYEIRDPIYGFIPINDWEKQIIDNPIFQRLRRIKQLALTELVYPGANHSRFEHSLGVMHLSTLMYNAIVKNEKNKKILIDKYAYNTSGIESDLQLIRLAALLHDVGHAPFSHVAEDVMPINRKTKKKFKHEDYSRAIILGPLKDVIENYSFNQSNLKITAEQVAALIEGNAKILQNRLFLKALISSQLDADRGDYLLRDSHHLGVKYGVYDYQRLVNTICLGLDPESDEVILGISEDGVHAAESLIIARYLMFTQVYFHKTRRAFDFHLKNALKKALGGKKLPPPTKIDDFIKIDDYDMMSNIKKIGDYNCQSIINRDHIRLLYSTPETPTLVDEKEKNKITGRLKQNKIWYHEDPASDVWYKLDTKTESKEIMVIDNNSVKPLSEYSNIVKNIGEIKKIRIYVKPGDREKAKGCIRKII